MSFMQAERVEMLLKARGVRWNGPWNGAAAVSGAAAPPVVLGGGIQLTLLSPRLEEFPPLARQWEEYRRAKAGRNVEAEPDEGEAADGDGDTTKGTAAPILIVYAHADRRWLALLEQHLASLTQSKRLTFSDADIKVGEDWLARLQQAIEAARIALVLVSPAALQSTFIMDDELPRLLKAVDARRLSVTWIMLAPCDWQSTLLAQFQALNDPREPLSLMATNEAERELARIAERLARETGAWTGDSAAGTRQRSTSDASLDVEALAQKPFLPDRSVPNGASIAFLAESHGKALLIGGDASAEVLTDSIRMLLSHRGRTRLRLDAFVLPHNGSARNLTRDLLQLVDCERYLVSTDGSKFRHPDRETIARILAFGRVEPDRPLTLVFNYRTQWTAVWDDPALKMRWKYEAIYPTVEGGGIKVQI
jgi:TIR domain